MSFDASGVSAAQAAATAKASGVTAAAGPFRTATLSRTRGPVEGTAACSSPGGPAPAGRSTG